MSEHDNQESIVAANDVHFSLTDVVKFGVFVCVLAGAWYSVKSEVSDLKGDLKVQEAALTTQNQTIAELKANTALLQKQINVEVPSQIAAALGELKTDIRWIMQRLSTEAEKGQ